MAQKIGLWALVLGSLLTGKGYASDEIEEASLSSLVFQNGVITKAIFCQLPEQKDRLALSACNRSLREQLLTDQTLPSITKISILRNIRYQITPLQFSNDELGKAFKNRVTHSLFLLPHTMRYFIKEMEKTKCIGSSTITSLTLGHQKDPLSKEVLQEVFPALKEVRLSLYYWGNFSCWPDREPKIDSDRFRTELQTLRDSGLKVSYAVKGINERTCSDFLRHIDEKAAFMSYVTSVEINDLSPGVRGPMNGGRGSINIPPESERFTEFLSKLLSLINLKKIIINLLEKDDFEYFRGNHAILNEGVKNKLFYNMNFNLLSHVLQNSDPFFASPENASMRSRILSVKGPLSIGGLPLTLSESERKVFQDLNLSLPNATINVEHSLCAPTVQLDSIKKAGFSHVSHLISHTDGSNEGSRIVGTNHYDIFRFAPKPAL